MNPAFVASAVPPWSSPPETLVIGRDEVHVWRAELGPGPTADRALPLEPCRRRKGAGRAVLFRERSRALYRRARRVARNPRPIHESRARTAPLSLRRPGEAGARRRIRRRCDPLQPLPLPRICPLRGHQGPPGRHRPRAHPVRREGRGNRRPVFPARRSGDAPGASSRHAASGVLSLLDAQGGLDQGPGRGIALFGPVRASAIFGRIGRHGHSIAIRSRPRAGLFGSLSPPPNMSPLLLRKDVAGVFAVGSGRTRVGNHSKRATLYLCRAHLSATRLTTR